jgi:hypothetical protein
MILAGDRGLPLAMGGRAREVCPSGCERAEFAEVAMPGPEIKPAAGQNSSLPPAIRLEPQAR